VNADEAVKAFVGHLRDEVDLSQLRTEIADAVGAAVEPASIGLWIRA
jgi:hypothetical protein